MKLAYNRHTNSNHHTGWVYFLYYVCMQVVQYRLDYVSKVSRLLSHLATPAGQVKTTTTTTTTTPGENTSSTSSTNTLAGANSSAAKNQNNSKRKREKLLQTESNDFKLVFISSGDSSKDSDQLNSSLENAGAADTSLPSANGEFIGDMEYEDELTVTNGSNSGSNPHTVSSIPNTQYSNISYFT